MFVGSICTNTHVIPMDICKVCDATKDDEEMEWTQVSKEVVEDVDMLEEGEIVEEKEKNHDIESEINSWIHLLKKRRKVVIKYYCVVESNHYAYPATTRYLTTTIIHIQLITYSNTLPN